MARLGTLLIIVGLCAIGYGVLWQAGLAPGSRVSLPEPVALARATPGQREVSATSTPLPTPQGAPATLDRAVPLAVADAAERLVSARSSGAGYATRLAIPAIKLDTLVEQGGIVEDAQGEPIWETKPFVAVHYGDLTSRLGVPGNAVIAGHVVTLNEGNVFRFLYQLDLGDEINVWDGVDRERDFKVVGVKLVSPSDTSVMDATTDETLTLVTCGGTFDPAKREFSDRLIVTAKPL